LSKPRLPIEGRDKRAYIPYGTIIADCAASCYVRRMPHPYDASTKYLLQTRLADWLPLCGRTTTARVEVIDADLATVTAAADRVLQIHEDPSWLLHIELQASRDPDFVDNLPAYNVLLERQHRLPVRTAVVLLRRAADAPELTGVVQREFPGEPPYLVFRHQVVRVWQLPVEVFLNGGLGILPLAPLSAVSETDLPAVIARMAQRVRQAATPDEAGTLWTATDVLMGLRYPRTLVAQLLQGVYGMKESVTYQAIVEEGEIQGAQKVLLRLGRKKFGVPTREVEEELHSIVDLDRLNYLCERLLDVSTWAELLTTP
jgi:hypothetical protein